MICENTVREGANQLDNFLKSAVLLWLVEQSWCQKCKSGIKIVKNFIITSLILIWVGGKVKNKMWIGKILNNWWVIAFEIVQIYILNWSTICINFLRDNVNDGCNPLWILHYLHMLDSLTLIPVLPSLYCYDCNDAPLYLCHLLTLLISSFKTFFSWFTVLKTQ